MFVARPLWMRIRRSKDMSLEQQKLHFFKSVPFFESLNYKQIGLVARIVHERHYSPNEYIFELNQPGAALFMIQSGEVVVEIPLDNGEMGEVAILSDGDFLGELALIDNLPRSASARVVKYTRAFALFRNDLLSLVRTHPEIACEIYRALALIIGDRLKATNKLLGQRHEEQRKAA
jgi:CRP-like cAMP-binding protein